jgi:hypothetical protein
MKRSCLVLAIVGIAAFLSVQISLAAGPRIARIPGKGAGGRNPAGAAQSIDYEFSVLDSAKVRLANPPVQFDDKGRPKKLTSEEMKKLKGDDAAEQKLTGIKSSFDVLKPGDVVQISFSRPKKPKDLENTGWTSISGGLVGVVTNVDAGKAKSLTVRVSPNGTPQFDQSGKGGDRQALLRRDAPKNVIKADQRQASVIVIVDQAPDQEMKQAKRKKNK